MGFFGSSKKKVTKLEFKQVRTILSRNGFSTREIEQVATVFRGDLDESSEYEKGIDEEEIEKGIKWLKENKHSHILSDHRIEILEEVLRSKL